ncbi:MAG: RNA-binding S4 domain-containing protein [Deinococcales bacterium]
MSDNAKQQKTSEESLAQALSLQNALKMLNWVETGGEAKFVIQTGEVKVNGITETRRKRKLKHGDIISFQGQSVKLEEDF